MTQDLPVQLWGFFHTDCIHESAAALVSLHRTKRGAWKAMHRAQWEIWEDARSGENTNLHLSKYVRQGVRCPRDGMRYTRSSIASVEVLE